MRPVPVRLNKPLVMPSALEAVPAGFPSPAQDYWSGDLDLSEQLIRDRVSTYIWRAAGHSMIRAGIHDQDLLLVDRGIRARSGHIVVAVVDGECTVKRLDVVNGQAVLRAENREHPDIMINELSELRVWGVVTWVLHRTNAAPRR